MPVLMKHFALATATVLALTLAGCGGDDVGPGADGCPFAKNEDFTGTLRLGYQKIPNGDLVVKDQELLESCLPEATVQWSEFGSGGEVVAAFGDDRIDLGLAGSAPTVAALSAPTSLPLSVVWVHDVIEDGEALVVRNGVDARDVNGLRGRRIATPFGSTAHYSLLEAIADAGLTPTDFRLVDIEPVDIPPAWGRGEIDAAWIWEPTLSTLVNDGGTVIARGDDDAAPGRRTFDLALVTNEFAQRHPDVMQVWARAQANAVEQLDDDPDKAAESIATEVGVTGDEAAQMIEKYEYVDADDQIDPEYLGGGLGSDLRSTADVLLRQKGISAVAAAGVYEGAIDPEPARAAAGR